MQIWRRASLAVLVVMLAAVGLQCATDQGGELEPGVGVRSVEGFYADVAGVQAEVTAAPDMAAGIGIIESFKTRLRGQTSAYEASVLANKIDPIAQQVYDEAMALLLTLNNIPSKPFSKDYCPVVREFIFMAWNTTEAQTPADSLKRSVREGLRFLEILCAK